MFTLSETTLRFFLPFAFTDYISICAFQSHGTWVATQDTKNSWRDLWNLRNDTQSRICHSFQLNYRLWRLFSHAKYSNGWISKSRIPNSRNVPTNFLGDPHATMLTVVEGQISWNNQLRGNMFINTKYLERISDEITWIPTSYVWILYAVNNGLLFTYFGRLFNSTKSHET